MSREGVDSSQLPLLGITGYKHSGKCSIARVLLCDYGYLTYTMSEQIIDEVVCAILQCPHKAYGRSLEQVNLLRYIDEHKNDDPATPDGWVRPLLQGWGMMRRIQHGADYWLKTVQLWPGHAISGLRLPDEDEALHAAGGLLWRVTRPGYDSDGNATEVHVPVLKADLDLTNDGTLDDLESQVHAAMATLGVLRQRSAT